MYQVCDYHSKSQLLLLRIFFLHQLSKMSAVKRGVTYIRKKIYGLGFWTRVSDLVGHLVSNYRPVARDVYKVTGTQVQ